jgi:Tol biopolymer transport system component/predicted Ser/Thr protein kinase
MELSADTLLHERYKIMRKLGQGGMGAVYEAFDTTLDTKVAVKTNFSPAQDSVEQFLHEARLLASLKHPNLPRVTDYFVIGTEQYLVMDFIEGKDLNERVKEGGALELNDVMNWADKLTSAIEYLHRQDPPVIHRDIKPANIKITPEGQVFLVDFGIAKSSGTSQETASGASGYSPGFAPPEQYGHGRTGPFSDQYSLAATIYTLLTTVKPVDSIERLMGKATLMLVNEINKKVPTNIADAIQKALSMHPGDRFASIGDFRKALNNPNFRLGEAERDASNANITQRPPAKPMEVPIPVPGVVGAQKTKKKFKGWVIALIIVGVLLCLGAIATLFGVFALRIIPLDFLNPKPPVTEVFISEDINTEIPAIVETTVLPEILPTETPGAKTEVVTEPPVDTATSTATVEPTSEPMEPVGGSGLIVFVSDRADGVTQQIWTMRVSQSGKGDIVADEYTQLTFDEGNKDFPAWSPDGSKITYSAPGYGSNGLDIWIMNADGTDRENLTNHAGDEYEPVWSPDGKTIVFTTHTRTEGSQKILQLYSIGVDGTNRTRISLDFIESHATFSPDGDYLAYVIHATNHDYLFIRNKFDDFTKPEKFDAREIFGMLGEVADPEFSPDGSSLVYTQHDGRSMQIVMITFTSLDSFGAHGIQSFPVSEGNEDFAATWSDDMRWLALTSTRDGGDLEIYIMTTAGRPQVNLTNRVGVDKSPDWMPVP